MGLAYLKDGTMLDYKDYIAKHPHWTKVRMARFRFDNGQCVICHRDLKGEPYQTHHLSYIRLGRERIRDVITLCDSCHHTFHQNWTKSIFWEGKGGGHWEVYDLRHTARMCAMYWRTDRLISKDPTGPNLCWRETAKDYVSRYYKDAQLGNCPIIDPNDLSLFVRNKRYELFFEAEARGLSVMGFLDDYYGEKVRGKNPIRQDAGRKGGPFDHSPAAFHRLYNENKNILLLMEEVNKIEQLKEE